MPREDYTTLAAELRHEISGEVRFDDGSRALYATDASNYRQVPIGVVIPRTVDDVIATIDLCRAFGAPVLSRGGGTSLAGQCCNVAVVMDFSKYLNRVLSLDPVARRAVVEPGCVLDWLRDAAEKHHLTFGPDPATHDHNTLGGMLGNNSCGVHSVMAGRTVDNVASLDVVTYDGLRMRVGPTSERELAGIIAAGGRKGELYAGMRDLRDRTAELIRARYPKIPRRVSGYNLDELLPENGFNVARALVGSEGTLVSILSAELQLIPSPPHRVLLVLGYPDVFQAGDHVPEVLAHRPIGLEGLDDLLIQFMRRKGLHPEDAELLPKGGGWLLAEFGGATVEEAKARAQDVQQVLRKGSTPPTMTLLVRPEDQKKIWEVRESGLGATAFVPGEPMTWPGWEDAAVPPDKVGSYLRDFRALLTKYGYRCSLYGHFGDGCIHCRISFDLRTAEGIAKWRRFLDEAAELVVSYGGSLSGEHGDGQARAELLPKMYGPELVEAMRAFKALWDPHNRMNPGKVVDPHPITAFIRPGPGYHPDKPATHYSYAEDEHDFRRTALRCVGVGKCRHAGQDVMCPSYLATREEKHSTRGRARLLFEMMHGGVITDGWRSDAVHEALDLCLSCKGCKHDCPVNVDMATYKSEFHAHYYAGRLRPRTAYSMGLIHWWSRAAARAPGLVNAVTQNRLMAPAVKWIAGIAGERQLPRYAPATLQAEAARRGSLNGNRPSVMLFPDTFNNHFHPRTGLAAMRVLEAAGYHVIVPPEPICCGRPLYAWGMLDLARKQLTRVMEVLSPYVEQHLPIVGLEPACLTSLVDELPALFPEDPRARALAAASMTFPGFLTERAHWTPPRRPGRALVHPHCYEHAVLGTGSLMGLLEAAGMEARLSQAGCCGMAGSFGFEHDHYQVAVACGERSLLPQVRQAAPGTVMIANGFACREQIAQGSGRDALHLADVLAQGLDQAQPQPGERHGDRQQDLGDRRRLHPGG